MASSISMQRACMQYAVTWFSWKACRISIKFLPYSLSEEFTLVLARSQCAIVLGWPRGQFGNWKWHNWICKTWSEVLIKGARAARPISARAGRRSEHWNLATGGPTQTTNREQYFLPAGDKSTFISGRIRKSTFYFIETTIFWTHILKLMNDAKS